MKSANFYRTTAWRYCSRSILLHHSFKSNGEQCVKCCTCNKVMLCKSPDSHAGHLVKVFNGSAQTNYGTAFDERNIYPQCKQCNWKMGGRELEMLDFAKTIHGDDIYDVLKQVNRERHTMNKADLQEQRDKWKKRFEELVSEKGNPWKK